MSEGKERGLIGEICIFAFFIALLLAAVYFTGNWNNMLNFLNRFMHEAHNAADVAKDSVNTMKGVWGGQ